MHLCLAGEPGPEALAPAVPELPLVVLGLLINLHVDAVVGVVVVAVRDLAQAAIMRDYSVEII